jgi:hypothetical protein
MLLIKLIYFALSGALFLFASYPLRSNFRNKDSFFFNLRQVLKSGKSGARLLTFAFINLVFSASLFFLLPNTN